MGFGIRLAPGLRISASRRGLRAGIGPRVARIHVGSGRPSVSTGMGGATVWTTGPKGRRRRSGTQQRRTGPSRTSLAAIERQSRANARAQEHQQIAAVERHLVSMHLQQFPAATKHVPTPPVPVDPAALTAQLQREGLAPLAWWKFGQRREAKQVARWRAPGLAAEHNAAAHAVYTAAIPEAETSWSNLLSNDPHTVLAALEDAFEDNESPAVAVDCHDREVSIVVLFPLVDVVPERRTATTPGGKPTLKPRSNTDRNQLYVTALGSAVLATAREAFATAPSIDLIAMVVVRRHRSADLDVIYHGRYTREQITGLEVTQVDPAAALLSAADHALHRTGVTAEVQPIDTAKDTELQVLLQAVSAALNRES